jgi:hypothetical protein
LEEEEDKHGYNMSNTIIFLKQYKSISKNKKKDMPLRFVIIVNEIILSHRVVRSKK